MWEACILHLPASALAPLHFKMFVETFFTFGQSGKAQRTIRRTFEVNIEHCSTICTPETTPLSIYVGKPSALHETSSPDWKPTLNLGHMKSKPASSDSVESYNCAQLRLKRKRERISEEAVTQVGMPTKIQQLNTTVEELSGHYQLQVDNGMSNHKERQTEVTGGDINILQEDCQSMQQEIHKLQR